MGRVPSGSERLVRKLEAEIDRLRAKVGPSSAVPLESMIEEIGDIVSISRVAESLQAKVGGPWLAWINPGSLVRPLHKNALRGAGDTFEEALAALYRAWRERE